MGSKPARAGAATQARHNATQALMPQLQPLLRKHQTVAAVAAPLVSLPRFMALELYTLKQEEEALGQVRGARAHGGRAGRGPACPGQQQPGALAAPSASGASAAARRCCA